MPAYPLPPHEADRQRTLEEFHVLDGPSDEDLDRLTRLASQMLGLPIALISLVDRDRQWFLSRVGLEATETPRDVAFCAHAICGDGVMVVADAREDTRFRDNPLVTGAPHIRFYAGAPLQSREGHRLGTLCVIGREPRRLTGDERQLLEDLAGLVMQHLEGQRSSWRCPLTGLLNRRPFFEEGEREVARTRQQDAPLSLVILDLDAFAGVNERFGRPFGDRVLREMGRTVAEECRATDLTGRVANDEFAILMPGTDLGTARDIAARIGRRIAAAMLTAEGMVAPLTASGAAAQLEAGDRGFADLHGRAEAALEQARRRGGNLTVTAAPSGAPAEPRGPGPEPR
jgi:diguanylate cyclase (GGDEF)-like protein